MIMIKLTIMYFIVGLLIWAGFPATINPPLRRPKFWKFMFVWGLSVFSIKVKSWIWKR